MSYEVIPTEHFERRLKKLAKKYPKIKDDIKEFAVNIDANIKEGDALGRDCYKIRLQITGKKSGKSGGARIILQAKVIAQKVYLLSIYDKGDQATITDKEIDKLPKEIK